MCRIVSLSLSLSVGLLSTATITSTILLSNSVSATGSNTDVVDQINITVPISCTLEGTGMNSHNAEILNGQYNSSIGETTLKAYCNDNEGFAIYAIGYTDDIYGKNVLTSSSLGSSYDINTGTSTSDNNSNWAMKLSTITSPEPTYPILIENSYDAFHNVPTNYELVAKRSSGTDIGQSAEGTTLKTTYQAYISQTQPAATYAGQVKYTLVHPLLTSNTSFGITYQANTTDNVTNLPDKQYGISANGSTIISPTKPEREGYGFYGWCTVPTNDDTCSGDIYRAKATYTLTPNSTNEISLYAMWGTYAELDTGRNVNAKMKSLASGTTKTHTDETSDIKAIRMGDTLPNGFTASASNTISLSTSTYPVYIWFDNTNDAGIMYVYTEADRVRMNSDSSYIFTKHSLLTDISGLEEWDSSMVAVLSNTFSFDTVLSDLTPLSDWDLTSVTILYQTFMNDTSLVSLNGLEKWDTSLFMYSWSTFAYCSSLSDISALSNWDTGNIMLFKAMFYGDSSLEDASALSGWDTSSAVDMSSMFGKDSSLTTIDVASWNTSNVTDMSDMFVFAKSLVSIDVSGWDTHNVTKMDSMFAVGENYAGNGQLTEIIGLGDLDVSNVTDMTCMFYGAGEMTHYDIADWDVSKVQSFNHMFADNFKLESLDLSKWDVSSLKTIWNMFNDDSSLTTVGDISHWNTVNLIDAGGFLTRATAFVGDNGTLDLSGWNTTNLKAMSQMFYGTNLYNIDLSGWTFDSITSQAWEGAGEGIYYTYSTGFGTAFQDTPNLEHVYVSQSGLDSFNAAVSRGVSTSNMWTGSNISSFTVK